MLSPVSDRSSAKVIPPNVPGKRLHNLQTTWTLAKQCREDLIELMPKLAIRRKPQLIQTDGQARPGRFGSYNVGCNHTATEREKHEKIATRQNWVETYRLNHFVRPK